MQLKVHFKTSSQALQKQFLMNRSFTTIMQILMKLYI